MYNKVIRICKSELPRISKLIWTENMGHLSSKSLPDLDFAERLPLDLQINISETNETRVDNMDARKSSQK